MLERTWRSELVLRDSRARLTVSSRSRRLLTADLPYLGEERLALRHILEGLALWQGPPLLLACDVDAGLADGSGNARGVPGLLVPPSPLVRASIGVRVTDRGEP